jgi:hypothetical protein
MEIVNMFAVPSSLASVDGRTSSVFFLVPKLRLGNAMNAKLQLGTMERMPAERSWSFAGSAFPSWSLGTR